MPARHTWQTDECSCPVALEIQFKLYYQLLLYGRYDHSVKEAETRFGTVAQLVVSSAPTWKAWVRGSLVALPCHIIFSKYQERERQRKLFLFSRQSERHRVGAHERSNRQCERGVVKAVTGAMLLCCSDRSDQYGQEDHYKGWSLVGAQL